MLRSFLLFLFFALALHALSDSALLHRAQSLGKSPNKSKQFQAYNDYKTLYLRALMKENEVLRKHALQGIVKSGSKLHIDIASYKRELASLPPVHTKKKVYVKKQKKKQTKYKKHIKVAGSHKLESVKWRGDVLELRFDKKLSSKQVNYFSLYDSKLKKYKYVFAVHASMLGKSRNLQKKGIDRIKLVQYTPQTLRLIIYNKDKLHIRFKKKINKLIITIQNKKGIKTKALNRYTPVKKVFHNGKVIVVDAGHGGKDPGATGYRGYREKVVVLAIAKKLKTILQSRGYKVYMTRDGDYFIKLRNRTKFANRKKADLFISIHANAVSGKSMKKVHGLECYFLDKTRSDRAKKVAAQENMADMSEMDFYGKEIFLSTLNSHNIVASNKLAIDLQRATLASLRKSFRGVKDAGVRPAPFWVLVGAQMPSVLVEVGFITHPIEGRRLANAKYQKKLAEGLANGVERYFINN